MLPSLLCTGSILPPFALSGSHSAYALKGERTCIHRGQTINTEKEDTAKVNTGVKITAARNAASGFSFPPTHQVSLQPQRSDFFHKCYKSHKRLSPDRPGELEWLFPPRTEEQRLDFSITK